jgi:hypothetical protein
VVIFVKVTKKCVEQCDVSVTRACSKHGKSLVGNKMMTTICGAVRCECNRSALRVTTRIICMRRLAQY